MPWDSSCSSQPTPVSGTLPHPLLENTLPQPPRLTL